MFRIVPKNRIVSKTFKGKKNRSKIIYFSLLKLTKTTTFSLKSTANQQKVSSSIKGR